ncbi:MAG: alpha/beta fold hydrolase [Clostridia bacterium]|nr:alpha/beta fold hydrolase [Clostridia bacterium]
MTFRFGEGYFPSYNKQSQVYYCHYTPDMPKGVVILIHGMGSYAKRYDSFAETLCENGFAVYAYDLVGHGRSVGEGEQFGTFAAEDGDVVLVKDLEKMTELVRRRFKQLPLFVFAHSLGSFIARTFVASHPDVFDGMILSGTAKPMSFSFFKRLQLKRLIKKAGRTYSPEVEKLMLGNLVMPFLNEPGSWLTTCPDSMPKKGSDPLFGHKMKADAYGDIFKLISYISSDEWLEAMPRALPVLILAGERDPLGGKALAVLVDEMQDAEFSKVSLKVYPNEKHELLGSLSHETAVADVIAFLKEEAEAAAFLKRQMREVF